MNKSKKPLAMLSTAAVAGLIIAAVTTPVSAKTTGLVVNTKDTKTYEYNFAALKESAKSYALNGANDNGAKLYNHFMANKSSMNSFYDDVKAGYVDAKVVSNAAVNAKLIGQTFVLDTFTSATTTATTPVTAAKITTDAIGNVIVDGKATVSSVSAITASTTVGTVATLPTTATITLSDGTTKAAAITWNAAATSAATYATAGTVTVSGTLADYGNYAVSGTVTVAANSALTVQSATVINSNEIKVVFNQAVNKETAENAANYTVTKNGAAYTATGTLTAKLLDDNKTVIINDLAVAAENVMFANGNTYALTVDKVVNSSYQAVTKFETGTQVFSDTTAPSLASAKYDGTNIVLYFNEPVDATSIAYKIDNGALNAAGTLAATTEVNAKGEYKVNITPAAAEKTTGTHSITVYTVADKASTPNALTVATTSYTVTADTTAPSVVSMTAYAQDKFKVKVSEPLNVTAANFKNLLTVKKGNYTILNADLTSALDSTDTTNTTYILTVAPSDTVNNPLYATGETSVALSVKLSGYIDTAGLVGADYNTTVNLSKGNVGPTVANAALNTGVASTITLKFNDTISGTSDANKITVKKNGIIIPVTSATTGGTNNDQLAVLLGSALSTGTYTVELAPGAVQDVYNVKNASTLTTTYTYTVATVTLAPTTVAATGTNSILVTYASDMDASATVLANYKLDGAAFPTGTTISFYGDKQHVRITLPTNYFSASTSGIIGITKNVKDLNGNYIVNVTAGVESEYTSSAISFTDNVKPTLTSSQYLVANTTDTTTNTIKLTFSENLAAVTDNVNSQNDFKVLVNGVKQTVTAVTDGTGSDKVITLTLGTAVNVNQAATISIVPEASQNDATATNNVISVTDVAGNKVTESSSVTTNGSTTVNP